MGCIVYELIHLKQIFQTVPTYNPRVPSLDTCGEFSQFLKKMIIKETSERIDSKSLYDELNVKKLLNNKVI